MRTLSLSLDDDLDAALGTVCAELGREKADVVADLLRKYLGAQRLKRTVQDPAAVQLYRELETEDLALAEEGMAEYQEILDRADKK